MPRLSVTIITRDEERDLPDCLASVAFADEIVVVDSLSRDRTCEIARAAGARVFERPWPGFAAQKQFALEQASGDWVLNLDADERCSPRLREALGEALDRGGVDGYDLPFQTWSFGRRLRFGGLRGEHHLRLFRRAKAHYPPVAVHEGVELRGALARLDAPIVHHPYASLEEYLAKLNHYTSQFARARFEAGRPFSRLAALRWPLGFAKRYLLRLGFLDGYAGFVHAMLSGLYDFLKYAKVEDLERERRQEGDAGRRRPGP